MLPLPAADGGQQLAAWVVAAGEAVAVESLRDFLREPPSVFPVLFADYLRAHTKAVWDAVLVPGKRDSLQTQRQRDLFDWLDGATMNTAAPLAYGTSDAAAIAEGDTTLVLFNATSTPETEVHGTWLASLRARGHAPIVLLVTAALVAARVDDTAGVDARVEAWRTATRARRQAGPASPGTAAKRCTSPRRRGRS